MENLYMAEKEKEIYRVFSFTKILNVCNEKGRTD